ncbi:DUF6088 family protein [Chitinophaga lutea]
MSQVELLKQKLQTGEVYRRSDLVRWSKSVDRDLQKLVDDGVLEKLAQGMYYVPEKSVFGKTPPKDELVVKRFLNDERFLITSPNFYNSLGVGTTQLYNVKVVYNHKRHGVFHFGKNRFVFRVKPDFPDQLTPEFLLVDLMNNIDDLAEDTVTIKEKVRTRSMEMDAPKLNEAIRRFGTIQSKKFFSDFLTGIDA